MADPRSLGAHRGENPAMDRSEASRDFDSCCASIANAMTIASPIFEKLKTRLPQAVVRQNEPLGKRTTLRVGGCAEVYVEPSSEEDLSRLVETCNEDCVPFMLLGRG